MKEITTEKIQHIAASYQKAKQKLTSVIEEMRELNNAITEINGAPISYLNLFGKQNNSDLRLTDLSDADLERYQINLETKCWRLLLNQTDIMSKVTQDDMDKIIQDVENRKLGDFTEKNIIRALTDLKDREGCYIANIAREVFRFFSPNYRQKEPIPRKIVENCSNYGSISFSSYNSPKWELLGKALLLLDYKPLPEQYNDHLEQQMNQAVQKGKMEFECPYFKAKFYTKSGTAHLTFTRMDLIETINKIGRISE